MKFVVVGLGSMGKRRIRLLKNNYKDMEIGGVDSLIERRMESEKLFHIKTYSTLETAIVKLEPDAVLICTSPLSHSSLILECINKNMNIFTELNLLADGYENIILEQKKRKIKLFLSSTFLYRKEINYIQYKVNNCCTKIFYRYHVGQYLPDWHPWENYKDFFVENKRTNGCREIFAIELPWIIKTFGKVKNINIMKDHISSLDLNYNDSYMVLIEHETGHKGVINVDIVSRKAIRSFEAYSDNMHIFWDGAPNNLREFNIKTNKVENIKTYSEVDSDSRYTESIIDNAYLEELDTFIRELKEDRNDLSKYTFSDDLYTLSIIDRIEGIK